MSPLFWFPIAAAVIGMLVGSRLGARSPSHSVLGGAAIGFYVGVMVTLPLLAIGLSSL